MRPRCGCRNEHRTQYYHARAAHFSDEVMAGGWGSWRLCDDTGSSETKDETMLHNDADNARQLRESSVFSPKICSGHRAIGTAIPVVDIRIP
jgi:hypothetical protein